MLSQHEAERLLRRVDKWFEDGEVIDFSPDTKQSCKLQSEERGEIFHFDTEQGKASLKKITYQTRVRKVVTLARIDFGSPAPHKNPDGRRIDGPHLHIYQDGFEDAWAFPIAEKGFTVPAQPERTFNEFCDFCAIVNRPTLQPGLF